VYGFTREGDAEAAGVSGADQESDEQQKSAAAGGAMRLVKLRAGDTLQQVLDFWNQI
jgi:hypothetical protein